MTVAPSIEAASSRVSGPSKCGTRPARTPAGDGGRTMSPARNPMVITASRPMITSSKRCCVRWSWIARIPIETAPTIRAPTGRGRRNRSWSATAPPTTSARSVASATTSAWSQKRRRPRGRRRSLRSSGSVRPVTIPSLADWYWMSMAIPFAIASTQMRR
ncbi:hypothetical protein AHiyo1_43350 [Arthrobacter sp. Hiyo1]|nr:hypothetical protein AHiyo1_43350 [Arthrobacter sp. Hiyo1]